MFRVLVAKEGLVYQYQHAQEIDSSHRPSLVRSLLGGVQEGNPVQRMVANLLDRLGRETQVEPSSLSPQLLLLAKTKMQDLVPAAANMTVETEKASSEVVIGKVFRLDMLFSDESNSTLRGQATLYRRVDGQLQLLSLKQIE